ncbi:PSD1 and planctomycete cytochrome C domain-containing protein [Blastopirellula marina]|uniref:Cytochrome C n=1 Tax=Blastopirellula marina TaxID=124 RepID=A0A2S8GLQ6_9BACT|nr:PSD1 and planctomycete cytochrome C domain-containing protein [Blastopirellula marina]PQO45365.1 cytochrome C [Blastopirellula marina]
MSIVPTRALFLCASLALLISGSARGEEPQDEAFFRERVAPILAGKCVRCHNDAQAGGGLSLVNSQSSLTGGESGASIVAGEPDASFLLDYLVGDKPDMPKGEAPLPADQIATLREWIARGAAWPQDLQLEVKDDWWSRQALTRPAVPKVAAKHEATVRTPIDAFVLAKLEERGMHLSREADARTIVRRLFYDLTGLPPTPEEMQTWSAKLNKETAGEDRLNDQAYGELVDHLLASPRYGERWARHWLDVVKYADTCGYDKDKLREHSWPYRDYVIRSFNQDKPYARFVQEQIAGDALFPGEPDGILGLGFVAAGPWDFIGHVEVPAEKIDGKVARNLDRDEMVSNTLNTFCSVTIQCARCHDHKFDPYTQEHYYGLQAVFSAVDRANRVYDVDPQTQQRRQMLAQRKREIESQLAALAQEMKAAGGAELAEARQQLATLQSQTRPTTYYPEHGFHSQIESAADRVKWVQIDLGRPIALSNVVLHACYDDFAGIGSGFGFPVRFQVEVASEPDFSDALLVADETSHDFPNPLLSRHAAKTAATARFIRVTATKLAERRNDFIFALAEVEVLDTANMNVAIGARVTSLDSIEAPNRWRRSNLVDGRWPSTIHADAGQKLAAVRAELRELEAKIETPERITRKNQLEAERQQVNTQLAGLPTGHMVYAAATDFPAQGSFKPTGGMPREVRVLHRGNVTDPRDEAIPGALPLPEQEDCQFSLPSDHSEADRRAALAQWITDPQHPLTWRSIVNRIWYYHFDQALAGSLNDFGRMGQPPTHPELLDWLAVEFRDNGQSFKHLHRLMVTSSVYRQSSQHNEAFAARDGSNQYLWRANRRRLEAEEIRDSILAVSGSLNLQMGGPGYYLFELEKAQHSPHYEYHKFDPRDPASHRRSIYRFVVRSQPDPYMTTLDCADSSQSTPKRDETLTALQALSMLNNPFQLVMAEAFAQRLEAEADTREKQIDRAIWLTLGRASRETERHEYAAFARQHGMVQLCRVLLNQSEFVYLD